MIDQKLDAISEGLSTLGHETTPHVVRTRQFLGLFGGQESVEMVIADVTKTKVLDVELSVRKMLQGHLGYGTVDTVHDLGERSLRLTYTPLTEEKEVAVRTSTIRPAPALRSYPRAGGCDASVQLYKER